MEPATIILIVLAVMSFVAFFLTAYDKLAAQAKKRRIPEKTLLLVGFFGGAMGMLASMLLIRHKTQHKNFMVLLPLFSILHLALIIYVMFFI